MQPIELEVDVAPDSATGFDRLLRSCVIVVFWRHFVVLVFAGIFGLILVPTRLGLAGIGSSTPLQGSTRLSRRFFMENLRWRLKNNCEDGVVGSIREVGGGGSIREVWGGDFVNII